MDKDTILRDLTLFTMFLSDEHRRIAWDIFKKNYPNKNIIPRIWSGCGSYCFYHPEFSYLETNELIGEINIKLPMYNRKIGRYEPEKLLVYDLTLYLSPVPIGHLTLKYPTTRKVKEVIAFYIKYFTNE